MPLRAKDNDRFLDQLSLFAVQQTDTDISLAAIVIAGDGRYTATHQPNDPPTLDLRGSGDGGDPRSIESTVAGTQQANEQLLETLYQLTMVQKMEYNAALEIALNEWSASPSLPPR